MEKEKAFRCACLTQGKMGHSIHTRASSEGQEQTTREAGRTSQAEPSPGSQGWVDHWGEISQSQERCQGEFFLVWTEEKQHKVSTKSLLSALHTPPQFILTTFGVGVIVVFVPIEK